MAMKGEERVGKERDDHNARGTELFYWGEFVIDEFAYRKLSTLYWFPPPFLVNSRRWKTSTPSSHRPLPLPPRKIDILFVPCAEFIKRYKSVTSFNLCRLSPRIVPITNDRSSDLTRSKKFSKKEIVEISPRI